MEEFLIENSKKNDDSYRNRDMKFCFRFYSLVA